MIFIGLDDIDNKILNLLMLNARMTYSEIGEAVGLSRVAVKNRIRHLEETRVIEGYHARINPIAVPNVITFCVFIETEPAEYDHVIRQLQQEPNVSLLFQISGNSALYCICTAESKEGRAAFARRLRTEYKGLTCASTKDIWEVLKGNVLPE